MAFAWGRSQESGWAPLRPLPPSAPVSHRALGWEAVTHSPAENTQVVSEHLFPRRGDSYMISCYFISLMKMHKKQNGQLARPFIPQVLAVSFWRVPFSRHKTGASVNCLRSFLPTSILCPSHPCLWFLLWLICIQVTREGPSRLPQLTRYPWSRSSFPNHLLFSFPVEFFIFSASPPARLPHHSHPQLVWIPPLPRSPPW